ncbi:MAG: pyridoxamine 5'-phosphate oxidase family protein [Anaerolineae bacterium]
MAIPAPTRPKMQNYGISDQAEGMLTWDYVREQMTQSRNYWISSTKPDGNPHAAPVWGVWVDDTLYFGVGTSSRKARNFKANPQIVVHTESGDEVVIINATVTAVAEDVALRQQIVAAYSTKYAMPVNMDDQDAAWYTLKLDSVLAWKEHDFPKTATRWDFP